MTAQIRLLGPTEELQPIYDHLAAMFGDRFRFKDCLPARGGWRWFCEIDPPTQETNNA